MLTMDRPGRDLPGTNDRSTGISLIASLLKDLVLEVGTGDSSTKREEEKQKERSVTFAAYDIRSTRSRDPRISGNLVSLSGEIQSTIFRRIDQIEEVQFKPGMNLFFQTLRLQKEGKELAPMDDPLNDPLNKELYANHRYHDSEIKLLALLAYQLTNQRQLPTDSYLGELQFPEFEGWLHFNSDFTICASCYGVILRFMRMFPNVFVTAESNLRPLLRGMGPE